MVHGFTLSIWHIPILEMYRSFLRITEHNCNSQNAFPVAQLIIQKFCVYMHATCIHIHSKLVRSSLLMANQHNVGWSAIQLNMEGKYNIHSKSIQFSETLSEKWQKNSNLSARHLIMHSPISHSRQHQKARPDINLIYDTLSLMAWWCNGYGIGLAIQMS